MNRVEGYPWGELVPGAYVETKNMGTLKVIEVHPHNPCRFRMADAGGHVSDVEQPPTVTVTAWVPTHEEAQAYLAQHLGARALESQATLDPFHPSPAPASR